MRLGRQFSVTRERIRQIEKALCKLKHPSRSRKGTRAFDEMRDNDKV
jgi:DNA-directed RNA polymerase sigma subunit (sigma70/sigma32)